MPGTAAASELPSPSRPNGPIVIVLAISLVHFAP